MFTAVPFKTFMLQTTKLELLMLRNVGITPYGCSQLFSGVFANNMRPSLHFDFSENHLGVNKALPKGGSCVDAMCTEITSGMLPE
jgi:hypothetical protein